MLMAIKDENQININELALMIEDSKHVRKTLIQLLSNMGENFQEKDEYLIDSLFMKDYQLPYLIPTRRRSKI